MIVNLGERYVEDLRSVFRGRLPGAVDLCCYWHEKARAQIAAGWLKRAGLLATQAIRNGASRRVLERIKESGDIFFAYSDEPWVLSGAAVHISFVGQDDGSEIERTLNGHRVDEVNANLTVGIDLTKARRLRENLGIAYQGPVKVGSFEVDDATARWMLAAPNPDRRSNADVIRPWANGLDITRRPRAMWIIDFGEMPKSEAALYEVPFEHVKRHVMPMRLRGRRASRAERWWLHGETVPALRRAIHGLNRYVCTTRVAKHRIFAWVPTPTLPDSRLVVFAREDDYSFGVLQSRIHEAWARATGSQLREVESGFAYTPTTCFETFPFPRPTDEQRSAIADAARELDRLRQGWLNPPGLSDVELRTRTLTNLYDARPTWLAQARERLDAAVLDAYGWPHELPDDDILARLLALNLEREPA